jgi:hypothetical protein
MISEMELQHRMTEIMEEYSACKEFDRYDLALEPSGDEGDIKVVIKKPGATFERVIGHKESLKFIPDTFDYPAYITPNSKDFALHSLKTAYFSEFGDLMVEHSDGSMEKFKVRADHKARVIANLKKKLGNKFKG